MLGFRKGLSDIVILFMSQEVHEEVIFPLPLFVRPGTDIRHIDAIILEDIEDIDEYMQREVLPHVPDAWVDESKTKVGYEIPQ